VLPEDAHAREEAPESLPGRESLPGPESLSGLDQATAVIGMSCRFPQAPDPAAFWRLLVQGESAIGETPESRRASLAPADTDSAAVRRGGHLDHVDRFDAGFFGISPREADMMDPQQRLILELGWEALEEGAIVPGRLGGSRTGVFIGAIWDDYAALARHIGPKAVGRYALSGLNRGIIANRLSYVLGLRGPSLTVDTGQSSSLVAVHLACESLRRGESELALAGGVNLTLAPDSDLVSARFGALSPDGRCHTFDARANGYVRGEGGGLVVLKPLARALADGDRIHAVIRGSAMNNDGGGDGLTAPLREAQEDVLRLAYRAAGVNPADVRYVELHGTGTKVGDPIEAAALGTVVGRARTDGSPLLVGSVKTNIGHLEGAAGIAGLLKTVLSISRQQIPASLNFTTPNPAIPFDDLNLRVPASAVAGLLRLNLRRKSACQGRAASSSVIGRRSEEGSAASSARIAENSAKVLRRRASSAEADCFDSAPFASSSISFSRSKCERKKSTWNCSLNRRWIGPSGIQANALETSRRMRLPGMSSMNLSLSSRASSLISSAGAIS